MVDETDLSQEKRWLGEERARVVVASLQKRLINASYVPGRAEARAAVLEMIAPGAVVARGDSVSIDQTGAVPELRRRGHTIIDPLERDAAGYWVHPDEERKRLERETFSAGVFLTSANAVTLDGKLVSTDAHGNRVSATIFGPDKVIIVAGVNKIVRDVDEALERIRRVCAPMNARRHYLKHHRPEYGDLPCVRTGRCVDCSHDWRLCRYTVIIEGSMGRDKGRFNVVMVGEELGI
ncbi:MAG: lactate utilization protein [Chloroflexota bacterium]